MPKKGSGFIDDERIVVKEGKYADIAVMRHVKRDRYIICQTGSMILLDQEKLLALIAALEEIG